MTDDPQPCDNCGRTHAVLWCPAYDAHLCDQCRWSRTETELNARVTALPTHTTGG
jgi:hypothetical protein